MAAHVQDVFMLFGDSITEGGWEPNYNAFGQLLTHVYARKLDVLNRGFSGYNTDWGIPVFEQVRAMTSQQASNISLRLQDNKPSLQCIAKTSDTSAPKLRVLAIWLGANDACIQPSPQHVPLTRFAANLKQMVHMVKSPTSPRYSPTTRIILISPPPVNTFVRRAALQARNPPIPLDRGFEVTQAYAETVRDVAKEEDVAFVDVWTAVWEATGKNEQLLSKFLGDGLHLNEAGYQIVYEELMKTIAKEYPDVHYDNLGPVFPPWAEIDWGNPSKSLYTVRKAE